MSIAVLLGAMLATGSVILAYFLGIERGKEL